ncbi:hypothetical protein SDC9_119415 [bioreactor metagenome]|uniref:Uncharacterized protein n=1 Tax=bioreactor metagenome TaxID=1076179 RepID=A0A645C479_9ZZZZ
MDYPGGVITGVPRKVRGESKRKAETNVTGTMRSALRETGS